MNNHCPDVLKCLANLSSDEVFTSPEIANNVLDLLPAEIWKSKDVKFLDPCLKTGVFLREIAKRLIKGLENEIPNLQERVNHILKNQLFGFSITNLTAQISRRSLYCSKKANGKYSIATVFDNEFGNISYINKEHVFKNDDNQCELCGANTIYKRDENLENYAYYFIHENTEEIEKMRFDVIIGNPPPIILMIKEG